MRDEPCQGPFIVVQTKLMSICSLGLHPGRTVCDKVRSLRRDAGGKTEAEASSFEPNHNVTTSKQSISYLQPWIYEKNEAVPLQLRLIRSRELEGRAPLPPTPRC